MTEPAVPAAAPPPPETVTMALPETGERVQIPAARAHEAYLTGQANFIKGTSVPVEVDGQFVMRPAEEAAALFDAPGVARSAAPSQVAWQKAEDESNTAGGLAQNFALGAGNALTLGLYKGAAPYIAQLPGALTGDKADQARAAEAARQWVRDAEMHGQGALALGEMAGLVGSLGAGALAGAGRGAVGLAGRGVGALGAVGEGAGLGLRGLGAVGDIGGSLVSRGLVGAGAAEGGALARLGGAVGRGATEMGILGVNDAISQSVIRDEPLTAEQLYAAGLHGALLGATGGAALHGLGGLVSGAGKLAGKALSRGGALAEEMGVPRVGGGSIVSDTLEQVADRKAIQSTGANLGQIEKLGAEGEAYWKDVARTIRDELPGDGKTLLEKASLTKQGMAELAPKLTEKAGAKMEKLFAEIEGMPGVQRPDLGRVVAELKPLRTELEGSLAKSHYVPQLDAFTKKLEDLAAKAPDFKAVKSQIADLKAELRKTGRAEGSFGEIKGQAVDALESELMRAGDAAAASGLVGAEWGARLKAANREYSIGKWIEKATEKGAKSEARNRSAGMSEHLGAIAGASVMGIPGALLASVSSNIARRYGDQAIAQVAALAAKSDAVKAIGGHVSHAISSSASAYVGGAKMATKLAPTGPHVGAWLNEAEGIYDRGKARSAMDAKREYREKRDALGKLTPDLVREHTAGLSDLPGTRAALEQQALRAAGFLRSKLPPEPPDMHPLQAGVTKPRDPSPSAMSKFDRYAKAVDDPLSVVEDMSRGRCTREGAEALRTVYPRLYGEAVGSVMAAIAEKKAPLGYEREKQLGILLGIQTSPMQSPALIAKVQAAYATQAPPPAGTQPGTGKVSTKGFNVASGAQTAGQKLAEV